MPFRSRSSHSLLALVVGSLLFGAAVGSASIAPPPELSDGGYLKVGLEAVRVSIENPRDYFWIGEKAHLIQKNFEYFVGIVESEYKGDQVFAVPRVTWGEQGTAWVTEQNEIVFGVPTYTVRGSLFLRPGEWLTVLDEDESRYRVLCSRYGRTFPIELKKSEEGITFQADLPAGMEERVVAMHAQSGLMARARPIITDETLREMGAPVTELSLSGIQPAAQPATPTAPPTAPPVTPLAASAPPPLPDPRTATAAEPSPPAPPPATGKDSKWLISNTAWSQELNQGDARVITPETVHTALEVADAPVAVTDIEAPPPNVTTPLPVETEPTLVASASETNPEMTAATPAAQPTEPAAAETPTAPGETPAPEETPDPEVTQVASATAETAAETNALTDLAVAAVPPPVAPSATLTTGAVATVVDYPTQRAEESPLSVAVKIILLTVAVLAVGVAVVMGLAWVLNRRKTPRRKKAHQEAETAKEERPMPTKPPIRIPPPPPVPTIPKPEPAPTSALPDDFSDRISFNGGVFTGTLDALTVSQLIQFIHSVEETGSLSVTHGSGMKAGKVMVRKGDIIDAQCEGQRGEDALREIITFKNGIFAFTRQKMDDHASTVSGGTMAVLMNVLKDFDEASEEPEAEEAPAGIL